MKIITGFECDKGSLVINGVCFHNGVGDGGYDLFFADPYDLDEDRWEEVKGVWFDLRESDLNVWISDCGCLATVTVTEESLKCKAVKLYRDENGNFALGRYF